MKINDANLLDNAAAANSRRNVMGLFFSTTKANRKKKSSKEMPFTSEDLWIYGNRLIRRENDTRFSGKPQDDHTTQLHAHSSDDGWLEWHLKTFLSSTLAWGLPMPMAVTQMHVDNNCCARSSNNFHVVGRMTDDSMDATRNWVERFLHSFYFILLLWILFVSGRSSGRRRIQLKWILRNEGRQNE